MTERKIDDAIKAALDSVERIEKEGGKVDGGTVADEIVQIVEPGADEGVAAAPAGEEAAAEAPAPKPASGQAAMLEAMIKAKNEVQEVLKQTQKESKDLFDRLARLGRLRQLQEAADEGEAGRHQVREREPDQGHRPRPRQLRARLQGRRGRRRRLAPDGRGTPHGPQAARGGPGAVRRPGVHDRGTNVRPRTS
jgi:hypothetical protein